MPKLRTIKVTKMEAYQLDNWYARIFKEDDIALEKMELFNKLYDKKIYERRNKTRRKSGQRPG